MQCIEMMSTGPSALEKQKTYYGSGRRFPSVGKERAEEGVLGCSVSILCFSC